MSATLDRRGFIGPLLASTAGLLIAPDALLWRPTPADMARPLVVPGALLTMEQIMADPVVRAAIEEFPRARSLALAARKAPKY